jgi:hypothetical protein
VLHGFGLFLRSSYFLAWLTLPARAWWHSEVAQAYAEEWRALEAKGLDWHLENGSWFRVTFKRRDGSLKIDTQTRQQRLDREISSVRSREMGLVQCATQIAQSLVIAAGGFVVLAIAAAYLGWQLGVVCYVPLFLMS